MIIYFAILLCFNGVPEDMVCESLSRWGFNNKQGYVCHSYSENPRNFMSDDIQKNNECVILSEYSLKCNAEIIDLGSGTSIVLNSIEDCVNIYDTNKNNIPILK